MHDDRQALQHPVGQRVGAPAPESDGEVGAIRHRRTHDGRGETLVAVRLHQTFFASDLAARVVPERVGEWRRFGDEIVVRRLLVGRGRADEDVLLDPPLKETEVALDVVGRVGGPIDHHIEVQTPQGGAHVIRTVDVGDQVMTAGRFGASRSAIKQIELESPGDRHPADRGADDPGAADEKHPHGLRLLSFGGLALPPIYEIQVICLPRTSHRPVTFSKST